MTNLIVVIRVWNDDFPVMSRQIFSYKSSQCRKSVYYLGQGSHVLIRPPVCLFVFMIPGCRIIQKLLNRFP